MAILGIGWVLVLAYAYPGVMAYDSIDQLREARAGFYSDGHPPAMAALWGVIDHLCAGPFGMLALQTAAFLGGVFLVMRRAFAPRTAALVTVLLALFPPILVPMAVIWKDAIMAGFLALGTGAVLDTRRAVRLAGLAVLSLATAMRYNALAATLPIVVLAFEWPVRRTIARYAVAAGAWVALTGVAFGLNSLLVDRRMHYWHSSIAVMDIVGTLAHVGDDLPDATLRPQLAGTEILADKDLHATIRQHYVPYSFEALVVGEHHLFALPLHRGDLPIPEARRDAIARAWHDIVFGHPGAFLAHRWAAFREVIGLSDRPVASAVIDRRARDRTQLAELGLSGGYNAAQARLERAFTHLARATPLFRPYLYLLVALCLIALCRRHRDVLVILLSGLGLEATLFLAAPTADYRYSHWLITCTSIAIVMLIARRSRANAPDLHT